jgi:CheY-like chemotaxis protein
MGLHCLIVTSDIDLLGQIKGNLSEHGALLDLRQDSESAIELAARRHWDGLVIDCDDVAGAGEAITHVRNSRSNKHTFVLAVTNGVTDAGEALDLGANVVLSKPVHETRLRNVLDVTIPKMEREHRRYFRYDVNLPVRCCSQDRRPFAAKMKNVSEGGLAINLIDPLRLEGVVEVEFDLPSTGLQTFHAKADVAWSDAFAMGLRFLHIDKNSRSGLQAWLNSLEGQSRLQEWSRVH